MDFDDNFKKTHRAPKAGRKADKKKETNLKKKGITGEKKRVSTAESNPKVFNIAAWQHLIRSTVGHFERLGSDRFLKLQILREPFFFLLRQYHITC
jgi:hypothetical protein